MFNSFLAAFNSPRPEDTPIENLEQQSSPQQKNLNMQQQPLQQKVQPVQGNTRSVSQTVLDDTVHLGKPAGENYNIVPLTDGEVKNVGQDLLVRQQMRLNADDEGAGNQNYMGRGGMFYATRGSSVNPGGTVPAGNYYGNGPVTPGVTGGGYVMGNGSLANGRVTATVGPTGTLQSNGMNKIVGGQSPSPIDNPRASSAIYQDLNRLQEAMISYSSSHDDHKEETKKSLDSIHQKVSDHQEKLNDDIKQLDKILSRDVPILLKNQVEKSVQEKMDAIEQQLVAHVSKRLERALVSNIEKEVGERLNKAEERIKSSMVDGVAGELSQQGKTIDDLKRGIQEVEAKLAKVQNGVTPETTVPTTPVNGTVAPSSTTTTTTQVEEFKTVIMTKITYLESQVSDLSERHSSIAQIFETGSAGAGGTTLGMSEDGINEKKLEQRLIAFKEKQTEMAEQLGSLDQRLRGLESDGRQKAEYVENSLKTIKKNMRDLGESHAILSSSTAGNVQNNINSTVSSSAGLQKLEETLMGRIKEGEEVMVNLNSRLQKLTARVEGVVVEDLKKLEVKETALESKENKLESKEQQLESREQDMEREQTRLRQELRELGKKLNELDSRRDKQLKDLSERENNHYEALESKRLNDREDLFKNLAELEKCHKQSLSSLETRHRDALAELEKREREQREVAIRDLGNGFNNQERQEALKMLAERQREERVHALKELAQVEFTERKKLEMDLKEEQRKLEAKISGLERELKMAKDNVGKQFGTVRYEIEVEIEREKRKIVSTHSECNIASGTGSSSELFQGLSHEEIIEMVYEAEGNKAKLGPGEVHRSDSTGNNSNNLNIQDQRNRSRSPAVSKISSSAADQSIQKRRSSNLEVNLRPNSAMNPTESAVQRLPPGSPVVGAGASFISGPAGPAAALYPTIADTRGMGPTQAENYRRMVYNQQRAMAQGRQPPGPNMIVGTQQQLQGTTVNTNYNNVQTLTSNQQLQSKAVSAAVPVKSSSVPPQNRSGQVQTTNVPKQQQYNNTVHNGLILPGKIYTRSRAPSPALSAPGYSPGYYNNNFRQLRPMQLSGIPNLRNVLTPNQSPERAAVPIKGPPPGIVTPPLPEDQVRSRSANPQISPNPTVNELEYAQNQAKLRAIQQQQAQLARAGQASPTRIRVDPSKGPIPVAVIEKYPGSQVTHEKPLQVFKTREEYERYLAEISANNNKSVEVLQNLKKSSSSQSPAPGGGPTMSATGTMTQTLLGSGNVQVQQFVAVRPMSAGSNLSSAGGAPISTNTKPPASGNNNFPSIPSLSPLTTPVNNVVLSTGTTVNPNNLMSNQSQNVVLNRNPGSSPSPSRSSPPAPTPQNVLPSPPQNLNNNNNYSSNYSGGRGSPAMSQSQHSDSVQSAVNQQLRSGVAMPYSGNNNNSMISVSETNTTSYIEREKMKMNITVTAQGGGTMSSPQAPQTQSQQQQSAIQLQQRQLQSAPPGFDYAANLSPEVYQKAVSDSVNNANKNLSASEQGQLLNALGASRPDTNSMGLTQTENSVGIYNANYVNSSDQQARLREQEQQLLQLQVQQQYGYYGRTPQPNIGIGTSIRQPGSSLINDNYGSGRQSSTVTGGTSGMIRYPSSFAANQGVLPLGSDDARTQAYAAQQQQQQRASSSGGPRNYPSSFASNQGVINIPSQDPRTQQFIQNQQGQNIPASQTSSINRLSGNDSRNYPSSFTANQGIVNIPSQDPRTQQFIQNQNITNQNQNQERRTGSLNVVTADSKSGWENYYNKTSAQNVDTRMPSDVNNGPVTSGGEVGTRGSSRNDFVKQQQRVPGKLGGDCAQQ